MQRLGFERRLPWYLERANELSELQAGVLFDMLVIGLPLARKKAGAKWIWAGGSEVAYTAQGVPETERMGHTQIATTTKTLGALVEMGWLAATLKTPGGHVLRVELGDKSRVFGVTPEHRRWLEAFREVGYPLSVFEFAAWTAEQRADAIVWADSQSSEPLPRLPFMRPQDLEDREIAARVGYGTVVKLGIGEHLVEVEWPIRKVIVEVQCSDPNVDTGTTMQVWKYGNQTLAGRVIDLRDGSATMMSGVEALSGD